MPALRHRSLFTSTVGVSWFSFTASRPGETETRSGLHFENQTDKINFVGQAVPQFTHSSVRNKWKKSVTTFFLPLQNEQFFFFSFINQIINVIMPKMHDYQCRCLTTLTVNKKHTSVHVLYGLLPPHLLPSLFTQSRKSLKRLSLGGRDLPLHTPHPPTRGRR